MRQAKSKIRILNFRKVIFQLFRELVNKVSWETALVVNGAQQNWQIFKEVFLRSLSPSVTSQEKSQETSMADLGSARQASEQEDNAQALENMG